VPLTRFPFVDALTPTGRTTLRRGAVVEHVDAGRVLIAKGDAVAGAYLVERGVLRIYTCGPTGREQTLYWVGPGESCILAINCVFSQLRYPAWVEVDDEDARIVMIPAQVYRDLFASEPALQRFTFDVLSRRVIELTESLADAGTLAVEQRIIHLLVSRCGPDGKVPMNQERIARHVGTAREVVSRIIGTLARDGLVRTGRGTIELIDVEALSGRLSD